MKALLTIAACRVVVERVMSMCIQLSFISAAGHPLHQAVSLLFFWFSFCFFLRKPHCKKMFCECLSLPFCSFSNFSNTFLTSFGRFFSKIKIFMAENSFFLFSFSCFYSHVSCPFFSPHVFVKVIWWQRTKHGTKRNEWSQWWEWSTRSEKGSFVGVFFSMTEGLSWWTWINQGECLGWWFLARLGSNSVFLVIEWLVCDTDSPRDTRKWMLIIISQCFLSPFLLSLCLPSFSSTLSQKVTRKIGQLEAARLNLKDSMVCVEDQRKKIVLETPIIGERQLNGLEEKTSKLEDRVTAALVIYEEHMSDYQKKLKLILHMAWAKNQSNDTKRKNLPNHWHQVVAPLQRFGMEIDSLKEDEEWVEKRWWSVGLMEEHRKRNEHEKNANGNNGRDETVVWWVELVILHMVLLMCKKKNCRGATDSIHCRVWCHDMFSEFRVVRNSGRWSAKCSTTMGWSMSL